MSLLHNGHTQVISLLNVRRVWKRQITRREVGNNDLITERSFKSLSVINTLVFEQAGLHSLNLLKNHCNVSLCSFTSNPRAAISLWPLPSSINSTYNGILISTSLKCFKFFLHP
ncbi:uncharacterized protein LOC100574471 isoform X1 [Acyrthosiphon pisum]|uniref:Uncharacterized protein n=1 Tax=Acyrthosiphon pisum TaxID=7029 RepID=A0A8R2FDK1_ACYPI|nr:uncharacterized protein LOC100574471 isoform X1 [Acyrthosiphon pisum]|eukprot:XP_008189580.1 PREDICTED: uncharacterized protein LOC100574471 isoform X1 [Acyrthosiphon pisum]